MLAMAIGISFHAFVLIFNLTTVQGIFCPLSDLYIVSFMQTTHIPAIHVW